MMSDAEARAILVEVWPGQSLASYQIVGSIGRFEGRYGSAFGGNHNWGASSLTTAEKNGGTCPAGTTPATDHDARGRRYTACIQDFPNAQAGARSLVRALTIRRPAVWRLLTSGDALAVAAAMARPPIYSVTPAPAYARRILDNARTIARSLREPLRVHITPAEGAGWLLVAALGVLLLVLRNRAPTPGRLAA